MILILSIVTAACADNRTDKSNIQPTDLHILTPISFAILRSLGAD